MWFISSQERLTISQERMFSIGNRQKSVFGLKATGNHESVKWLVLYWHIASARLWWLWLQHCCWYSEWITSEQDTWWRWSDAHCETSHFYLAPTKRLPANQKPTVHTTRFSSFSCIWTTRSVQPLERQSRVCSQSAGVFIDNTPTRLPGGC